VYIQEFKSFSHRFGGSCCLLENEGSMALRNIGILPHHYTVSHPGSPRFVFFVGFLSNYCQREQFI